MNLRPARVPELAALVVLSVAIHGVAGLPQAVSLTNSTMPCSPETCQSECSDAGRLKGDNITTTNLCLKPSGVCNCCVLPDCEAICYQRRRKERPRSKEVRSRCNDKGECYCNFIFFEAEELDKNGPSV